MEYLIIFLFGISFGSFFNVCIYRIPKKISIIKPNSHCFNCKKELRFKDMIPVVGYFLNKGKCNYCGAKYSIRYSLVELLSGLLFVLAFIKFAYTLEFFFAVTIISLLLIITFIDFDHMEIPDSLNIIIFIVAIIHNLIYKEFSPIELIIAFLIGGGIFLIIALIGPMGGGDIKLMAALSIFFGPIYIVLLMILSFIVGGIISILLLITKKKNRKDYIPFGPFIAFSAMLLILYGPKLLQYYLNIIG
ncbi:prepilin peptidase [Helicovermis profundi]|uniref:A24 family peptidase n=1 Tax=Helicovermis profundi TaxID=3065157 RepID=A0AAU9E2Z1_9FIRM|nr:A24 family peptidase [Clostridia bacterium S502]